MQTKFKSNYVSTPRVFQIKMTQCTQEKSLFERSRQFNTKMGKRLDKSLHKRETPNGCKKKKEGAPFLY